MAHDETMNPILLIIDDDASVREGLRTVLELKGYEVRVAADAETAIDLLTTLTPALVILDHHLPGMNGSEAAHCIRKGFWQLPILGISAHSERAEGMLEAGATEFLPKPLDFNVLLGRVAALLEESR